MFILWFSLHVPHVFISSLHLLAKCPQCLHFMHCVGSYFCFVGQTTSAKINISYSILFNLTTSYSYYFGGKKRISRNKTSFFLLMLILSLSDCVPVCALHHPCCFIRLWALPPTIETKTSKYTCIFPL